MTTTICISRLSKLARLPRYATPGASGLDLHAAIERPVQLESLERFAIPTGIAIEIPPGVEAQVRPRSGLAVNQGVTVLNTPGTVDSDYRGEVKVILVNLSHEVATISPGDRIAQLVFARVERVALQEVSAEELSQTGRGTGGFGSTGR